MAPVRLLTILFVAIGLHVAVCSAAAQPKVIVIGAGMSGVSAARTLADSGAAVTVLEGRARIGGRTWSDRTLGFANDMGASWIHGPIPFAPVSWTSTGPPVAAPTSYASLQADAATAGWTYKNNPTWDPSVTPKPWNPITQLAYKVGVPLIRTYFSSTNVFDHTGASQSNQGDALMTEVNRDMKACRESIGGDVSFTDMLATVYDGGATKTCVSRTITNGRTSGGLTAAALLADPIFNYQINTGIEFQTGGGAESIGFLRYDTDSNMGTGKEDWIFPNGYDQLITYLATNGSITTANSAGGNLNISTGKVVTAINYGSGSCTVSTGDGSQYVGDMCISTIPAGVMKRRNPQWTPSFPAAKAAALQRIKMGDLGGPNKVFILFATKFWTSDELFNGFLQSAPSGLNRGKWSYVVDFSIALNKPVLLAFCLGNYSATMEKQTLWENWLDIKAELQAMCTTGGNSVCPSPGTVPDPISSSANILYVGGGSSGTIASGAVRSTWITDPFSQGAYSYSGVGTLSSDWDTLAAPIRDSTNMLRVSFAGEHTSLWYRGTVHGAYISGQRAAAEVLDAWANKPTTPTTPTSDATGSATVAMAATVAAAIALAVGTSFAF